jgi:hypothetical protein
MGIHLDRLRKALTMMDEDRQAFEGRAPRLGPSSPSAAMSRRSPCTSRALYSQLEA